MSSVVFLKNILQSAAHFFVRFTICKVQEHIGSATSFLFISIFSYIHYLHILVNFVPEAMVFLHHL